MVYDYDVKLCGRCNEHYKYKDSSDPLEFLNPRRERGWDPSSWETFKGEYYCPPCLEYRGKAIERAIMLAERNFERKKFDYVRCSECSGNGTIGGITCPKCEGEGRIKNPEELLNSFYSNTSKSNFEQYKEYLSSDFFKK